MKLVIFYINNATDDMSGIIDIIKHQNKEVIEQLTKDGYQVLFVPTKGESTRVEKIEG